MPGTKMIKSVIKEYGVEWVVSRSLYSAKLKTMNVIRPMERLYEKDSTYPSRVNIFDIDVERLKIFIRHLDKENQDVLIRLADNACNGVIKAFSSLDLNYGNPIDWQLNPLTGKRCDEKLKWFQIPDFDTERGDVKVIWEPSRFSHFITLVRAYLLTENRKYYEAFSSQLKSWLKRNPYSYGANFKCGQECSLRLVNALLSYTVFKNMGIATDADESNVKDLIDRCYRKILSNFFYAYKCIKNNHTISELMGMIVGAWCCEDEKQLQKAYRLLDEVIDEQFTDDGGYRQFSFNYQRLALQDIEVVLSISETTKKCLSQNSFEKIRKAAYLMYQCQDESGDMPNYGSNDGALVFPVTSCGYRDFRSVINTSYALSTGNQLYKKGVHQEELIWFGEKSKIDDYKIEKVERASCQFLNAGLFTIRQSDSWTMIVSNEYRTRPAHMDQLHFDLWVDGVNVFCDAGTYSYASEEGRILVKNESHNTSVVKNQPQMNSHGTFMVCGWTKRKIYDSQNELFDGTLWSTNGYSHHRQIATSDRGYLIRDEVDTDSYILFHTPCDVIINGNTVKLSLDDRALVEMRCNNKMKLKKSKRSLYYLKGEATSCIAIKAEANKKVETIIEIKGERII